MATFYLFLSVLFGLAAVHPFVIYPLTLMVLRKHGRKSLTPSVDASEESFAICMCAYNEESVIKEKAENLLAIKRAIPGLEVRIYVDAASDNTAAILEGYKDDFHIFVAPERHGKSFGMNKLVSEANASIIVFTDANVMLESESILALRHYFSDPTVGCVCGHLKYTNSAEGVTAATGSLYWRLEEFIKQAESDTGSVMGADGSIFAIRKSLHVPPPADIIDDMFVSFNILCNGHRVVRGPDVVAFEESVTASKEEFKRKVRIACQAFNVHRLLWPKLKTLDGLNLYKYLSHKLLRWFTLVWIILSVIFFLLFLFAIDLGVLAVLLVAAVAMGIALAYNRKISPVLQLIDIFYSFAGTALGVFKSIQGERFQIWSPAQSIRKQNK